MYVPVKIQIQKIKEANIICGDISNCRDNPRLMTGACLIALTLAACLVVFV